MNRQCHKCPELMIVRSSYPQSANWVARKLVCRSCGAERRVQVPATEVVRRPERRKTPAILPTVLSALPVASSAAMNDAPAGL
jgi:DNA-directed RNA polymerase subunit M/transcription elongation factor TFIIS